MLNADDGYLGLELFYGRRDLGVSTRIVYCMTTQKLGIMRVCVVHVPLASNRGPGVRIDQDGNQWFDGMDQSYSVNLTPSWAVTAG
jgi:hypothetical protein